MTTEHIINNLTIRENDDGTVDIIDKETGEPKNINSLHASEVNTTYWVSDISNLQSVLDSIDTQTGRQNQGGAHIILEEGEHVLADADAPINLSRGIHLTGEGEKATIIDASNVTGDVFVRDDSDLAHSEHHITVSDLAIVGDGTQGAGFRFENVHYWRFVNVRCLELGTGFDLLGSYTGELVGCTSRLHANHGIRGVNEPTSGMKTNNIRINRGSYNGCGGDGIHLEDGAAIYIRGANAGANDGYGIFLRGIRGAYIQSYTERNGKTQTRSCEIGLSPDGGSTTSGVVINSCYAMLGGSDQTSDHTWLKLGDVKGVTVEGNDVYHSQGAESAGIELGKNNTSVTIGPNNFGTPNSIAPPTNGDWYRPAEINEGRWSTSVFGSLADIENVVTPLGFGNPRNGITVLIHDDLTASGATAIDGSNYPRNTRFVGKGSRGVTLTSNGDATGSGLVILANPEQTLENVWLSADETTLAAARLTAGDARVENVKVRHAGSEGGIVVTGNDCHVKDNIIQSANVAGPDVDDSGTRTLINNWGTNAGDPSVEGQWNSNGKEGVNVYDSTNGVKYSYVNGDWR